MGDTYRRRRTGAQGAEVGSCRNVECLGPLELRRGRKVTLITFRLAPHLNCITLRCHVCGTVTSMMVANLIDFHGDPIPDGMSYVYGNAVVERIDRDKPTSNAVRAFRRQFERNPPMPPHDLDVDGMVAAFAAYLGPIPNVADLI